jgi:CelD/BcsL family acetyltransferase involved in cellulose biosynthesis
VPHRSPIHAFEWHRSFLDAQEPHPDDALYVVIFAGGEARAILPLRPVRRMSGLGRHGLEVPVNPHVPFSDIVVSDRTFVRGVMPVVLEQLATVTGSSWDYLLLRRTPADSAAVACLRDVLGFPGWTCDAGHVDTMALRSYDEFFYALSSHFRNNLRRAHKRAEALGGVTYHTGMTPRACSELFPEFLAVEASGWKGAHGTGSAIALDDGRRRFYEALMHGFAERERCRIDVVRHDGRPIAAAFSLVTGTCLYGLKIGFDESYARIAPGNLLHWYIVRTACEEGRLKTFNMASDAAWHAQWRPRAAPLLDVVVVHPGVAGLFAGVEQRAIERARGLRRTVGHRWLVSERGKRRLRLPVGRSARHPVPVDGHASRRAHVGTAGSTSGQPSDPDDTNG